MLKIEKIEDTEQFAALRDEWNELLKNSDSDCLFLTWEWLYTWWKHLSDDRQLHIVTLRDDGRLIAIAPFSLRSRRWKRLLPFSALEFLGSGDVGSDYLDIIIRRGQEQWVLIALADYLSSGKHMFELSRISQNSVQISGLVKAITRKGWDFTQTTTDVCPCIDLSGHDWDSYLASRGPAHRSNLRRRHRKIEQRWNTRFDLARSEEQRSEALQALIALHNRRWRERGSPGAFHSISLSAFHDELSRLALERQWLRLYVLRLDGEPVAAVYGFCYGGVFYFYQSGFDLGFQKYSVGLVAMGLTIKTTIEEGAVTYDFLHGDESYKFLWANAERKLIRVELYPPGERGALYRNVMETRWSIKKMALSITHPGAG